MEAPAVRDPETVLFSKPARAVVWFVAMGLCVQWWPGGETFRLWSRPQRTDADAEQGLLVVSDQREGAAVLKNGTRFRPELGTAVVDKSSVKGPIAAPAEAAVHERVTTPEPTASDATPLPIVDPTSSLHKFYAALEATAARAPGAITRIAYHGDSIVTSDYVTGTLRRALQSEFGDGGHGFVLMADAWPSYFHNDVYRLSTRGFEVSRIVGPYNSDGLYGLGGVSFVSATGVRARFGTVDKGDYGRRVSRFEVSYLEYPGGGQLGILLDGEPYKTVSTDGEAVAERSVEILTSDGPHLLEVFTQRGMTRTFGVVMERQVPGVVLDAIGIQGARIRFLDKQDDRHWAQQLRQRKPNLLAFQFGANESSDGFAYSMSEYHETMAAVLRQAIAAVPDAGCLVVGAMDQAKKEGAAVITRPIIPHLVREQEAVAKEVGCAFWNTYEAMGGQGSMAIWVRRGLGQADMTHPSGWGAQVLGNWLYGALKHGYDTYLHEKDPTRPFVPPLVPHRVTIPPPTNDIPPLRQRE